MSTEYVSWTELRKTLNLDEKRLARGARKITAICDGYRLMEIRESLNLTQKEFSEKSGVSKRSISLIEKGKFKKASIASLQAYIEGLGGEFEIDACMGKGHYKLVDGEGHTLKA